MELRWLVRLEATIASRSYRGFCLGDVTCVYVSDLKSGFRVQRRHCDLVCSSRHTDRKGHGLWNNHSGVAFCLEEDH